MTVDVNVKYADETMLEDIDEIMEDTMVQMFVLQPRDETALNEAIEHAEEHACIFYVAPFSLKEMTDGNCVGYSIDNSDSLNGMVPDKPLFIEEAALNGIEGLLGNAKGVILDATKPHETLEGFSLAIGPGNIEDFDKEVLAALPMERIVLQSGYPEHGFDEIYMTAKRISDTMFRPEQSIIANATRSALLLLGFKK